MKHLIHHNGNLLRIGGGPSPVVSSYRYFLWYVEYYSDNLFHQQDLALYDANDPTTKITGFTALAGKQSSNPSTENYPNGVDGNLNTKWYSDNTYPNWVIFTNNTDITPTGISYRAPGDQGVVPNRAPRKFKLCGSNTLTTDPDDASWEVIYQTDDNVVFRNASSNTWTDLYWSEPVYITPHLLDLTPPEPGVVPNDMDFVYQAKDFDGYKIPNKAPNSTFGDYLQMGTLTINDAGSGCYLSNNHSSYNYLYKELTNEELTKIKANNNYYTFFVRMMNFNESMGGIMSCRLNGGYCYMIRNNGTMIQFHGGGWIDLGDDFLINVDRVYKLVVGPNGYYYGKNLDTGVERTEYDTDSRDEMGNIMSTFNASSESDLDRFYAFAGIARETTDAEDLAIKDALMNQSL